MKNSFTLVIWLCLLAIHSTTFPNRSAAQQNQLGIEIMTKNFVDNDKKWSLNLFRNDSYQQTLVLGEKETVVTGVLMSLFKVPIMSGDKEAHEPVLIWNMFSSGMPDRYRKKMPRADAYVDVKNRKIYMLSAGLSSFGITIIDLDAIAQPYPPKSEVQKMRVVQKDSATLDKMRKRSLACPEEFYWKPISIDVARIYKQNEKLIVSLGTSKNAVEQIWTISLKDRVWEKTFDASQNVEASAAGIKFLKAVVLNEKLYLMDNQGKLVITGLTNDALSIVKTEELKPIRSRPAIPVYWDVIPGALYITRTTDNLFQSVKVVKIPLNSSLSIDTTDDLQDNNLDASSISVRLDPLSDAISRWKTSGIYSSAHFISSLYVTKEETRMAWVFQNNTLSKWTSIPQWSSPPGTSGMSYIIQPKEYNLKTNIALPYIAFCNKGTTYIVNVNGKVYEFSDNQFVERRFFKHERIPSSPPTENVSIPDSPVILVLNKDTPSPSWLRFVVRDGIAQVASENNGITNTNDATTKNISNALNRALKALDKVEWRVDDIPIHPQKKPEPEVISPTPPPVNETLLWKELPDSKVEGTGLTINRQKTPLTRVPEGFEKPQETLVPPPPGYLYWANYHRWDDGLGYVSHYALWKKNWTLKTNPPSYIYWMRCMNRKAKIKENRGRLPWPICREKYFSRW